MTRPIRGAIALAVCFTHYLAVHPPVQADPTLRRTTAGPPGTIAPPRHEGPSTCELPSQRGAYAALPGPPPMLAGLRASSESTALTTRRVAVVHGAPLDASGAPMAGAPGREPSPFGPGVKQGPTRRCTPPSPGRVPSGPPQPPRRDPVPRATSRPLSSRGWAASRRASSRIEVRSTLGLVSL